MCVDKNFDDYYKRYGDCYNYHFIKLTIDIHRKRYDKLYDNYLWLFSHKKCKREECIWVITRFVIQPIKTEKDYALGNKRIKELLEITTLPKKCRKILEEWKEYLIKLGLGELTDYETYYERVKKNLCTTAEYEWGVYSFVVLPLSNRGDKKLHYNRIQDLLAIETIPQRAREDLLRVKNCFKKEWQDKWERE